MFRTFLARRLRSAGQIGRTRDRRLGEPQRGADFIERDGRGGALDERRAVEEHESVARSCGDHSAGPIGRLVLQERQTLGDDLEVSSNDEAGHVHGAAWA